MHMRRIIPDPGEGVSMFFTPAELCLKGFLRGRKVVSRKRRERQAGREILPPTPKARK